MKMCGTCSKKVRKSVLRSIWKLRKILSLETEFQFLVSMFGALYLPNQAEPARAPNCKVGDLTWYYNFVNYALTWIATV